MGLFCWLLDLQHLEPSKCSINTTLGQQVFLSERLFAHRQHGDGNISHGLAVKTKQNVGKTHRCLVLKKY